MQKIRIINSFLKINILCLNPDLILPTLCSKDTISVSLTEQLSPWRFQFYPFTITITVTVTIAGTILISRAKNNNYNVKRLWKKSDCDERDNLRRRV